MKTENKFINVTVDGLELEIDMNNVFIPYYEKGNQVGCINNLGVKQLSKEFLKPFNKSLKESLVHCAGNSTSYEDLSIIDAIQKRCKGIKILNSTCVIKYTKEYPEEICINALKQKGYGIKFVK